MKFLEWYWKNKINTKGTRELLEVFIIGGFWMTICSSIGWILSGDRGAVIGIFSAVIPFLLTYMFFIFPYQEYKERNRDDRGRRQRY